MKAYIHNLPARFWALLAVPAVLIAYPLVRVILTVFLHAIVPESVRSVLNVT